MNQILVLTRTRFYTNSLPLGVEGQKIVSKGSRNQLAYHECVSVCLLSIFSLFSRIKFLDQNFANAAQSGLQRKTNENLTLALFNDHLFHFLDVPKIAETFVQTTKQCLLQCIKNRLCLPQMLQRFLSQTDMYRVSYFPSTSTMHLKIS